MALEPNNTALKFETMLRRHLARGGAVVAACTGFDADAASAYLEGALASAQRNAYEAHLAGCPTCRRHFVELSRLTHSLMPTPSASVSAPRGLWDQLQTTLAAWFEPGEWRWQWAPAAAGVLVLAVLGVQLWQQTRLEGAQMARAVPEAAAPQSAPAIAPTPAEASVGSELFAATTADPREFTRRDVPKPNIGPQQAAENYLAINLPQPTQGITNFNRVLDVQAPGETRSAARSQAVSLPAPPTASLELAPVNTNRQTAFSFEPPSAPAPSARPDAPPVIAARLSPPEDENPARRGKEKATLQPSNASWRNRVLGYMPLSKTETERKSASEEASEEISRFMVVRIHDKIFRFEQGVWIDQAYKPEMQWRVLKLVRGSQEYEQVLAAEPQLKDFFARGSIVILWKDKIYKVVGQ